MAGGMGRDSRRPSLAERTAASRAAAEPSAPAARLGPAARPATPAEPGPASAGRHCWVIDAPGHPGRWAGLLLEWRRTESGWQGLVAFRDTPRGPSVLLEQWLDVRFLQAAE